MSTPIRILVVDDNDAYRQAFVTNLETQGWQVGQAPDADAAVAEIEAQAPDVMITDLQMRTPDEGLRLIRTARSLAPCLPVIMISAVGTFDEGAEAIRLGAAHVLSKARIEDEISVLYDCVRRCQETHERARAALNEVRAAAENDGAENLARLREIVSDADLPAYVRDEAADVLASQSQATIRGEAQEHASRIADAQGPEVEAQMAEVDAVLSTEITGYDQLDADTRDALRTAEFLYRNSARLGERLDISRTACFSYSFAVENQAKAIFRKRVSKFVGEKANMRLVQNLMEDKTRQVNMFVQQHLLQTMRERGMEFSIENVRQTFLRILEHRARYRPDGLKALGIMILVFGRSYTVEDFTNSILVDNPMCVKGLASDEQVADLAELLIRLQHLRNPYIHPEIQGCEPVGTIRDTAVLCLNLLMQTNN